MNIVLYDFEVFKFDTLFGAIVIDNEAEYKYQIWGLDEIKKFYIEHKDDLWVGWNNYQYDDNIIMGIVNGIDPFELSQSIIHNKRYNKLPIEFASYDLMNATRDKISLKLTELIVGKSIDTTEVSFDLDRPLTEEEKELTEKYNLSDLLQTKYNFEKFYDKLSLRIDMINEFNLPFKEGLKLTESQIAERVLKVRPNKGLAYSELYPTKYSNLKVNNKDVLNFVYNREYENGNYPIIKVGNADIQLGIGGLHSAENKFYAAKAIYLDVSGYYNLIMLNYDLLPRNITAEGKKIYKDLYERQLELKKTNPTKRQTLKTILLAVGGSMNNAYSGFYDPYKFVLMTTTGQLFAVDLLEKLAPFVMIVNSNTDGFIVVPNDWEQEQTIKDIVNEWQERTKFVIKYDYIYDLYQRDVNYYFYKTAEGKVKTVGLKNFDLSDKAYSEGAFFNCKEPPIIAQGVVNYFLNGIEPADFISDNRHNLRLYQYSCKKGTYDKLSLTTTPLDGGTPTSREVGGIVRVFASNSNNELQMIYKIGKQGKSVARVANLPDNIFLYNGDITGDIKEIEDKIDYNYYVERIQNKIKEFIKSEEI